MKIVDIKINNFKRLKEVNLELANADTNIIFVNGANGNGKTTFLTALTWCLFGHPISPADFAYASLEELQIGESASFEVQVTIQIDELDAKAVIKRERVGWISGTPEDKKIDLEREDRLTITVISSNPALPAVVTPEPEEWLKKNLPTRFKQFILFDGEQMYKFFDVNVKGAVENAVREIAKIDYFNQVIDSTQELNARIKRRLASLSGNQAEKIQAELSEKERLLSALISDLRTTRSAKEVCSAERVQLEEELKSKDDLLKTLEENRNLNLRYAKLQEDLGELKTRLSRTLFTAGVSSLLLSRIKYPLQKQIADAQAKGRYPADYSAKALQVLLEDELCICGNKLKHQSDSAKLIEGLIKTSIEAGDVGNELKAIEIGIKVSEARVGDNLARYEELKLDLRNVSQEMAKISKRISELMPSLQGVHGLQHELIEKQRRVMELNREHTDYIRNETLLANQIESLKATIETLRSRFASAVSKSAEAMVLSKKVQFLDKVLSEGNGFADQVIANVREKLQGRITEQFRRLKNCEDYSVTVTDEFEVVVSDRRGRSPSLSEGQKMSLAYMFSIALREVVGLSYPLIVDTPLGRVDEDNRKVLADALIQLGGGDNGHQIIMLMHAGEYTPYTKKDFEGGNPLETYLGVIDGTSESRLGLGIDPEWYKIAAWADYAAGRIQA